MSVIRTKNRIQFAEDFVLNNKKIGIGTDNPQATLDVAGNANVTGLITASQLSAGLYQGEVRFLDNVFIDGNITIAGTQAIVDTTTLRIEDADIILGFTTNQNGDEVSSDDTANHGGIAVASTEGTPLSRVVVTGIETLPATYKKIMWFKSDTFSGVSTDAWMINYGVSIGNTTNVPNGTRLAAGDVLIGQDDITAVRNVNAAGIITGNTADFNSYTDLNVTGVSTFNDTVTFIPDGLLVGTISSTAQKLGGIVTWPELQSTNSNADLSTPLTFEKVNGAGTGQVSVDSTIQTKTSGKYYIEVTLNDFQFGGWLVPGVRNNGTSLNSNSEPINYSQDIGSFSNEYGLRQNTTTDIHIRSNNQNLITSGGTDQVGFSAYQTGDIIGILLDLDNNTLAFSQNGSIGNSVPVESGLNYKFALSHFGEQESSTVNFGETPFTYTPPAGYQGLFETSPYVEVDNSGLDFVGVSTFADDVTVSGNLNVSGVSTFNDTVTFNPDGLLAGTISSTSQKFGGIVTWPELESPNVNAVFSNDNLTLTGASGGGYEAATSTIAATSGKVYVEFTVNAALSGLRFGIVGASEVFGYSTFPGRFDSYGLSGSDIIYQNASVGSSGLSGFEIGDIFGILLDLVNNTLTFSRNGVIGNSVSIIDDPLGYKFAVSAFDTTESATVNFGETAFSSLPAGYQGLYEETPYVEVDNSGLDFVGVSTFADDVTVSGNLSVTGVSTFNDTVTLNPDGALVGTISSTSQYLGKKAQSVELESPTSSAALSNNNLTFTSSDTSGSTKEGALSTLAATSGKIYAEITIDAVNNDQLISYGIVGVSQIDPLGPFNYDGYFGNEFSPNNENSIGMRGDNSFIRYNGSGLGASGISTQIGAGDVMGLLLDLDANQLAFSYNGFVGNFVDISAYDDPLGFKIGATVITNAQQVTFNFGETPFVYEPPAGYVGLYNETPYVEVDNSGLDFVGVSTFTDSAIFDSTGSIQIPVGTTAERPGIAVTGQIRYNTENSSFEGYGPGGAWGSLGGVKDVDGDTYILAETSAGSDEDTLYFYTGGELTGTISTTNGITGDGENIRAVNAPKAALASYASHSETSNSALSIAGLSTYTEVGKFTGSQSGSSDDFGNALAVSADGKTIVVGAVADELTVGLSGLAYVFDREGNNFNQVGILSALPSNTDTNDRFGYSVAISDDGKTIAVGADRDEAPGNGDASGVVYVYDRVGNDFNRVGILTGSLASDGNDNFGYQVALNGDGKTLIVGAPADETDTLLLPGQGVAYVFDKVGTTYNQVGILTATVGNQDASDKFGRSVQVSSDGNTFAIGAEDDEIAGSGNFAHGLVYIFDRNGSSFDRVGVLTGTYAQDQFDDFGAIETLALSANGRTIAVGAPADEISGSAEGLVYVFDRVGDAFSEVGILTGSYIENSEFFGKAVSINADGTVIAAATGANADLPGGPISTGVVYVFNRQGEQFNEVAAFIGSDTTTGDVFGSSLGISADGKSIIVGAESGGANTGQVYVFDEEKETYVYSDAEGNIGIGSAIPTEKLDVAGNIIVSGTVLAANLTNVAAAETFTASPGVAYTMDSYTLATDNLKTAEYTIHIENGSTIQSQKLLVMQNGTTAFSQEYAIMFDPDSIVSIASTLNAGVVSIEMTPETGVLGLTTYRYTRQSII